MTSLGARFKMADRPEKICCLHRKGAKPGSDNELIRLTGNVKVTVGRAATNDVVLSEVPSISRQHAVLEQDSEDKEDHTKWTIMDLNSSNGIHINGTRITPGMKIGIKDRDVIEIGKDPASTAPGHYRYTFYKGARIKVKTATEERNDAVSYQSDRVYAPPPLKRIRDTNIPSPMALIRQRVAEEERILREQVLAKEEEAERRVREMEQRMRDMEEKLAKELAAQKEAESELEKEREEERLKLQQAEQEARQRIEELQRNLAEQEAEKRQTTESLLAEKERIERQLEEQREQLAEEQGLVLAEMQARLAAEAQEKEEALKQQLSQELLHLQQEREQVVQGLEEQLAKVRQEEEGKDGELSTLQVLQQELTSTITAKEEQLRELQQQLQETKGEALKVADDKKNLLTNLEDLLESELLCSICSELFVKTLSLNCSHSFCSLCISQWMERKAECPNCRAPITSYVQSLVLDNYIEKQVAVLSQDMRDRRKTLVEERKVEEAAFLESKKKQKTNRPTNQQRGGNNQPRAAPQQARATANARATASATNRNSLDNVLRFAASNDYVVPEAAMTVTIDLTEDRSRQQGRTTASGQQHRTTSQQQQHRSNTQQQQHRSNTQQQYNRSIFTQHHSTTHQQPQQHSSLTQTHNNRSRWEARAQPGHAYYASRYEQYAVNGQQYLVFNSNNTNHQNRHRQQHN